MLTDDGVIMYAENDLSVNEPALENGLEVGTYGYSSTTRNITVNLTFDDNTSSAGNSGFGKMGTPAVASAMLSNSNNTLTINGEMMFTRDL